MIRNQIPDAIKARVVKLKKEGLPNTIISLRTGLSKEKVTKILKETNPPPCEKVT